MIPDWSSTSVSEILQNRVNLGHMISQKSTSLSFKNKKLVQNPKEDWITVLNTHEPIIDEETFDIVQKTFKIRN
jgi:hypothetical protein